MASELDVQYVVLLSKYKRMCAEARSLLETACEERRSLSRDEEQQYATLEKELDLTKAEIEGMRKRDPQLLVRHDYAGPTKLEPETKEHRSTTAMNIDKSIYETPEVRDLFTGVTTRSLMKDKDSYGGFTVPEVLTAEINKKRDNECFMRRLGRVTKIKADSAGFPVLRDNPAVSWGGEVTSVDWDSTMNFEKVTLHPHRLTAALKISNDLLLTASGDMRAFIIDRLAYALAIEEEQQYMTGLGAQKPLGFFSTNTNGVTASRNVSSGNGQSNIGADGLINACYGLRTAYLRSPACRWVFHRDVMKKVQTLKTGDGQYLFSIDSAGIARILGIEVIQSEYAPNTMTSGLRVGCIADFSYYAIAEYDEIRLLVDPYTDSATNQTRFIMTCHVDGAVIDEDAYSMVTLA